MCSSLCGAVMEKIMVGSCCNEGDNYNAQEVWAGKKYNVVGLYSEFCQSSFYDYSFGVVMAEWKAGRVTHYTLSAQTSDGCLPNGESVPTDPNTYITQGHWDTYIDAFVTHLITFLEGPDAKLGTADDRRIYIRLMHELNGNWYPWSSNPANYAAMWRYVWDKVMKDTGITKTHVQWIFEPVSPYEPDAAHDFRLYWPGDDYVDWLSLDAYNDGAANWQHPWEIFDNMLYKLREWRPALPVAISETGCPTHFTQSNLALKAQWFTDLFPYLAGWNVQMVVYFNLDFTNPDGSKSDYNFFSSDSSVPTTDTFNTTFHVFNSWKTAVQQYTYPFSVANNPRIMTDDEFQGHLPGYASKPTQPRNLMIYDDGATFYQWAANAADGTGKTIVNLKNTTQHISGETSSLYSHLAQYANIQFHSQHDGANTSFYTGIQFDIYCFQSNINLNIKPYTATANLNSTTFKYNTAKTWQTVSYTFSYMGIPPAVMMLGFYIQSNNPDMDLHMTQVQIISGPVNWVLVPPGVNGSPVFAAPIYIMLFLACVLNLLI